MIYLQEELRELLIQRYYVDVEYNRNNGKVKTIINEHIEVIPINCYIRIHSRGMGIYQDNLIALVMEKSLNRESENIKDKNRLIALTKDKLDDVWSFDSTSLPEHVCRYGLGVYYEIAAKRKEYMGYYIEGKLTYTKMLAFDQI
jgi:hypothetical protein